MPLQHCSLCGHQLQAAVTTDGERSKHALRRCPACSRVWNRDSNAAVNMLHILLHQHGRGTKARPSHLARPPRQGPPALQPPAGEDDEEDMAGELAVGCEGMGDILLHKGDGDRSCTTVVGTATAVQQGQGLYSCPCRTHAILTSQGLTLGRRCSGWKHCWRDKPVRHHCCIHHVLP